MTNLKSGKYALPITSIEKAIYQLEYVCQVAEVDGDAGIRAWLDIFKLALDRSHFEDYERMLLTARHIPRFSHSNEVGAVIIHNEGLLRLFQGRLDEAEYHFRKALALYRKIGDHADAAYTFNNLGELYCNMKDFNRVLEFYQQGLQIAQSLTDQSIIAIITGNIGLAVAGQGQ